MSEARKLSMCDRKVSFRTESMAKRVAEKHGQRVYECPICFCWHCTSKEDWLEDVCAERAKKMVAAALLEQAQKHNEKKRELGLRIDELLKENHRLTKLLKDQ